MTTIGITGFTSGIGRAVVAEAVARGHEVVRLGRGASADRGYDLAAPEATGSVDGLDAVVHLAWSWSEAELNVPAGERLVRACAAADVRPVLLSTFSAFAEGSRYGADKSLLERRVAGVGGASVRAGLVWGAEPSGIVATLLRLAGAPVLAPRLRPDPALYHTSLARLARALVAEAAGADEATGSVALAAYPVPVMLSTLLDGLRAGPGLALPVPIRSATAVARAAERLRLPLPVRSDSLAALGPGVDGALAASTLPWLDGFEPTEQFLRWARSVA
ncbi:MAG: hypothetical protein QM572_16020 [Nocardioides sp.]|uniref:NAD-dependent epimerase/dehydratase family protein n=1 Tax=Nocardioides sp. TaxID=35761 RepID=UPI0039E4386C